MPGDPTRAARRRPGAARLVCARSPLMARSRARHRPRADAEQVQFHYDVSDDFYALWLDPQPALFVRLLPRARRCRSTEAQEAKLEHICTKLMLQGRRPLPRHRRRLGRAAAVRRRALRRPRPGHHAEQEPARPRQQADRRARTAPARVRMDLLDYRHLDESEPYDKIASVGMFEHVGRARLPEYFAKIRRLLKPGGLLLNHGITAGGTRNHQLGAGPRRLHRALHLPGRRAGARLAVLEHDRRRRPRAGRRREPAPALREDALGLERRARGAARHGAHADHRHRPARLPALPRRQRDVLRARLALAAPDAVPRGRPATSVGGRCAAHNRQFPFNRGYMYPQR